MKKNKNQNYSNLMKNKEYLDRVIKRLNKRYISLKKKTLNPNLVPYIVNIKHNNLNTIFNNEINIKDVLNNMLNRTNKIYDIFQISANNIKLDNEEYSKRAKIIRNIKDFISNNILFSNNKINSDNFLCDVIYFFDLLIIQNKKYKLLSTFEKLGLGALILLIKFNKLQEKILIKKYKSIFNDKYMTLEEINKIEVLSLRLINYYIIIPNITYYINFLYKNIFINNKCKNIEYISKSLISVLKSIMSYSNNYMKHHPFYLSCFIIKNCFENYKIDGFQKVLIDYFDMNMRIFRTTYEEFINNNHNQIMISLANEKKEEEEKNKSLLYKKREINSDINSNSKKYERNQSTIKNNNNSTFYKSCKKEKRDKESNSLIKHFNLKINPMNNTYYKKFLDNYISEDYNNNNELSEFSHKVQKTIQISDTNNYIKNVKDNNLIKVDKNNCKINSPKKCGISINYRQKKKIPEKQKIIKMTLLNLKKQQKEIINKKNENIKDKNNDELYKNKNDKNVDNEKIKNIKNNVKTNIIKIVQNDENKENIEIINRENKYNRLNTDINSNSYTTHFYSNGKNYRNKNIFNPIINKNNNYLTANTTTNKEISNKILDNDKTNKKENDNSRMKYYLEKIKNYKSFQNKCNNIGNSNHKNIINQNESTFSNYKDNIIERNHKINIRNFYKQRNTININFSNFERRQILFK